MIFFLNLIKNPCDLGHSLVRSGKPANRQNQKLVVDVEFFSELRSFFMVMADKMLDTMVVYDRPFSRYEGRDFLV